MTLLSKSAILGADDLKIEDVTVPQWGGVVRIRTMTGQERDEFRAATTTTEGSTPLGQFFAALLAACIVDEAGERIFSIDDMAALRAKSAQSLDAAAAVAMRLNGLAGEAIEEAKNG
jgi:hypothetical protein